jgi:hypothetical protein
MKKQRSPYFGGYSRIPKLGVEEVSIVSTTGSIVRGTAESFNDAKESAAISKLEKNPVKSCCPLCFLRSANGTLSMFSLIKFIEPYSFTKGTLREGKLILPSQGKKQWFYAYQ